MKLALGTAQFGLNYGVSNKLGQVEIPEVRNILSEARNSNINILDTAISYGSSERVLGEIGVTNFDIVTKLPPMPKNLDDIDLWANLNINSSLNILGVDKLYALLLHNSNDFINQANQKLFKILIKLKEKGTINKIGVSIYDPNELDELQQHGIKVDLVQVPYNLLDRRIESSGWLDKLNHHGVEIHSRSVFLQGLLLQKNHQRNKYFQKWENYFKLFDEWVNDSDQSVITLCLSLPFSSNKIKKVIVGVQNKFELIDIVSSIPTDNVIKFPSDLNIEDPMLLNPSNWRL
jgi:aryl-alcohol dehydrogenase-like predicted oxidoreductase